MNMKSNLIAPKSQFSSSYEKSNYIISHFNGIKIKERKLKFDIRLLQLLTLLRAIHRLNNKPEDFSLNYIVEIFKNDISEKNKYELISEIKNIGYERLKDTFQKINLECESYLCFGILKRHQFSKETPNTDPEKLHQTIQFLHITLIHINILNNSRNNSLPKKIIAIKNKAFKTLEPFVNKIEEILVDIYSGEIINRKYFFN